MSSRRQRLGSIAFVAFFAACATNRTIESATSMSSMVAPELHGRVFHTILVHGAFEDLGILKAVENHFVDASTPEVRFVPSYRVLFPGRSYTESQVTDILRDNNIEAVLVISARQAGTTSYYVPPTYKTGCSVWSPLLGCTQVTSRPSGGGTYNLPWAQFNAQVYDISTGLNVWIATASTGGTSLATNLDLVESMADTTLERLAADRVVVYCTPKLKLELAMTRLAAERDSLTRSVVESQSAHSIRYTSGSDATPEQRRATQAREDSLNGVRSRADSAIQFWTRAVKADSEGVLNAQQAIAANRAVADCKYQH